MLDNFDKLLNALHTMARRGDAHKALLVEAKLYTDYVKTTESDEHYQRMCSKWANEMMRLGEKAKARPAEGDGVAFFFTNAGVLAHTDVVAETIRLRPKGSRAVVVCLNRVTDEFKRAFDCPVFGLTDRGDFDEEFPVRYARLRGILRDNQCGTLVWVSVPTYCAYVFGSRIAAHQVYWSLRFHPLAGLASIDQYVCGGARDEATREYFGQTWDVAHAPHAVRINPVGDFDRMKAQVPFHPCFGVVAREEKIAVPEYLDTVRRIVTEFDGGGFLWTGRKELPEISRYFEREKVPHCFMGWVDPDRFVSLLDCYLETHPLGGLCTWTAMGHGVPMVALRNPHTRFGCLEHAPEGLFLARDGDEYVRMGIDAIRDQQAREKAIIAGHMLFAEEQQMARHDAEQFWRLIAKL